MKELFLLCALALPPSSGFTKKPARFSEVFELLESYTENVQGRHSLKLMATADLQVVMNEGWYVKAEENWPPWKEEVFDLVWIVNPFLPNHVFSNRIVFLSLSKLVAPKGFIIVDVNRNAWMEGFILRQGFRKLPFVLEKSTIYQRRKGFVPLKPNRLIQRLKIFRLLLSRCA